MTSTNESGHDVLSLASDDDREAVCYLCLGGGVEDDDAGQPLRRATVLVEAQMPDFVHLSCLTDYAETKSVSRLVACRNSLNRG